MSEDCPDRDDLRGLITGELQIEAASAVGRHVDTCAHCETELIRLEQEALSEFRGVTSSGDGSFIGEPACARALRRAQQWRGDWRSNVTNGETAQLPPDVVRDYELLERLGDGGMGLVFKARHRRLDQLVALKLIRPERVGHPQAIERFEREIRAAGQLQHPNVVAARDAGEADGHHFLVMDLLDGETLAERVSRHGPMQSGEACALIAQAAVGLQHIHDAGMVHRDVKPSNLFVTSDPATGKLTVKILDMGLALLDSIPGEGELTHDGQVMGTYDYIAPEQAKRSHDVDIRADIYSLGCTLYFLLTGHAPFEAASPVQKLLAHQSEALPAVAGLSEEIASVLARMTAKVPADRFQTPADLVDALAYIKTNPVLGMERSIDRRRVLRLVGAASLLLPLAIGFAAILNGTGKPNPRPESNSDSGSVIPAEVKPAVTNRSAAEWARSIGAEIRVDGSLDIFRGDLSELADDFQLNGVDLVARPLVASDLRRLDGLQYLDRILLDSTGGEAHCQEIVETLPQLDLPALRWLYLRNLPMTDDHSEQLSEMQQVGSISLMGSQITDVGLAKLSVMSRLNSLELSGTAVTGRGLHDLQGRNILQLRLVECPLDSDAFIGLPHWPRLCLLLVDGCPLNDQAIHSIGRFDQLTEFGGNALSNVTSNAWTVFERLPNLTKVRLRGNKSVTDSTVRTLSGLRKLSQLSLHSCSVTDEGLSQLSRCSELRELDIRGCDRLTPQAVRKLQDALRECVVLSDF